MKTIRDRFFAGQTKASLFFLFLVTTKLGQKILNLVQSAPRFVRIWFYRQSLISATEEINLLTEELAKIQKETPEDQHPCPKYKRFEALLSRTKSSRNTFQSTLFNMGEL